MGEEGEDGLSVTGWLGIGALTLTVLWVWKTCRVYNTFTSIGIPGPKPLPLLGNIVESIQKGFVVLMNDYYNKYGKVMGFYYFARPVFVIGDLEMLREILVKKFSYFPNRMTRGGVDQKPWKLVLTQLRGDHWKHVRAQLSPTFSSGKMKRMMPAIQRVTGSMTDYLTTVAEKAEPIELKEMCGRFAMDVIAAAAFSIDVDSLHQPDTEFVKHAMQVINPNKIITTLMIFGPWAVTLLSRLGLTFGFRESLDFFMAVSERASEERLKDTQRHDDFLQLLVEAEKEGSRGPVDEEINFGDQLKTSAKWTRKGLTKDEMNANAFLFLIAGYETVSTVMSFTLFSLAHNPECLEAAQHEVDQILGQKTVDYDLANKLTFLDMCMNEAMRMYPPAFILNREAIEDVEVNGVQIKKGTMVFVPACSIHMDPDIWPDPDKFDPLRHTAEEKAKRHPFAFLPFGMGPRNCIGMRLAQLEVRMALASVLQHFSPVPCDKSVYPPRLSKIRMHAKDGLWIKLQPRQ